jgi:hypothetical protein
MLVIVGAVATQAGRRAAGSEQARGVLAGEQAALRRVATLVARQPSPAEVFAAVTEEAARLLDLDNANLIVYERDQTATVVGGCNLRGPSVPVGTRAPLDGDNIIGRVFRTQRPARIDQYADASGPAAEYARRARLDQRHNDRVDAPEVIARLTARMGRTADSAEQRRLVKRIARLQALSDAPEEER